MEKLPFIKILLVVSVLIFVQAMTLSFSYAAPLVHSNNWGNNCYTVQYGDTLFSIGRRYGVNPYDIAQANSLYNPDYIYPGQVLCIPSEQNNNNGSNNCYTVQYGDTLISIGQRYGVNPYYIAQVNGLYNLNNIYAGQIVCIIFNDGQGFITLGQPSPIIGFPGPILGPNIPIPIPPNPEDPSIPAVPPGSTPVPLQ